MADLSALSDDELLALARAPKSGLAAMSDAQLLALKAKTEGRKANDDDSFLSNSLRPVMRGLGMGFADEIAAGTKATIGLIPGLGDGTWGERYDKELTAQRGRNAALDEDYPVLSGAGQLGGAILGSAATPVIRPLGAAVSGARALGNVAADAGIKGAVAGFGEGEGGFGRRMESAGIGGAVGTGLGAGAYGALALAKPVVNKLANLTGLGNAEGRAERILLRSLDRDNVSLDTLADKARFARDGDILPDLAGRNTVNVGATAANVPGRSMEMADQLIQGRRYGGPDRVASAIDTAMGGGAGGDVADVTQALIRKRAEDAAPLYQKAFDRPAGFNEPMKIVLEDPITKAGLARGLEIQRIENTTRRARGEAAVPTTDPSIHYDDLGVPRIVGVPNMRSMDAVKRGLDSIIEDARDSTTGRINWTEKLRAVDDMRRTWVGLLDHGNSDYAAARAAWGGPSSALDAVALGRKALGADRDAVAAGAAHIDPGNMPFVQLGAGRALADRLSDPATMPGQARKIIEDRQMQARLQSVLPEDMRRDFLIRELKREVDRTAVDRAMSPRAGSQTARLLAGKEDMEAAPMNGMVQALLDTGVNGGLVGIGARVLQNGLRRSQGINPSTADALARHLFNPTPEGIDATIKALRTRQTMDALARERAAGMAQQLISGSGAGLSLGVN